MRKLNNKQGFTLIEIIVVLIIIGVLAAIALPNLFSNVTKSRGSAAIAAMDGIKSNLESLAMENNRIPTTADLTAAGLHTTAPNSSNVFQYSVTDLSGGAGLPSNGGLNYVIIAADAAGNEVALLRHTSGTFGCNDNYPSGNETGPYAGDCGGASSTT